MMKQVFTRLRGKLKSRRGFTLIELVSAMMVLALLGMVISIGVSTAVRVQRESTFISHSDMLTSTLNTALSDVLRYSVVDEEKTEAEADGRIYFSNSEYMIADGYIVVDAKGRVGVYMGSDKDVTRYFVSNGTYTGLRVSDMGDDPSANFVLSYDKDTKVFQGSYIVQEDISGDALTKTAKFAFKCVA